MATCFYTEELQEAQGPVSNCVLELPHETSSPPEISPLPSGTKIVVIAFAKTKHNW